MNTSNNSNTSSLFGNTGMKLMGNNGPMGGNTSIFGTTQENKPLFAENSFGNSSNQTTNFSLFGNTQNSNNSQFQN